jgi:hypothetical protein
MSKATSSAKSIFGLEVSGSLTNAINQLQNVGDANFVKAQAKIFKKGYMKQLVDHYLAINPDQDKSFMDFFSEIPNSTLNKYRSESKEAKEIQMKKDKEIMDRREENLREMRAEQEAEAEMAQKRAEQAPAMDKGKKGKISGLFSSAMSLVGAGPTVIPSPSKGLEKKKQTSTSKQLKTSDGFDKDEFIDRYSTRYSTTFLNKVWKNLHTDVEKYTGNEILENVNEEGLLAKFKPQEAGPAPPLPTEVGAPPTGLVNPPETPAEVVSVENNTQQAAINAMPGMGANAVPAQAAVAPGMPTPGMETQTEPIPPTTTGVLKTIGQPDRGLLLSDVIGTFVNPRPGSYNVASGTGQLTPNSSTFDSLANNINTIKDVELLTPAGRKYLAEKLGMQQQFYQDVAEQQIEQLPYNFTQMSDAMRKDIIARSVVPNPYTQSQQRYLNYLKSIKR